MIKYLNTIARTRTPWLLLAATALGLELAALTFQYGLKLDPCVMCIYERVATLGVLGAGLVGAIWPALSLLRYLGLTIWGISTFWGLKLALEHTNLQLNPSPFATCAFEPEFPAWMPLHQWLPGIFGATGDCSEIVWQFLGWSMPQWLIVCFALYGAAWVVVTASTVGKRDCCK